MPICECSVGSNSGIELSKSSFAIFEGIPLQFLNFPNEIMPGNL